METATIILIILTIAIVVQLVIIKRIMTTKDIVSYLLKTKTEQKENKLEEIKSIQNNIDSLKDGIEKKNLENNEPELEEQKENIDTNKEIIEINAGDNTNIGDNVEIVINNEQSGPVDGNEVFHLGKNEFTYEEAHAACQTLDSRLATEEELMNAWKNGANWCNYGWTQGQKTMFPIQKDYWNTRNCIKPKGQPHPCGEIGVNGGFRPSPHLKFGVNCYGKKPERSLEQIEREKKWQEEKDKYDLTTFRKFSKEELDKIRNKRYEKILAGMKKDILVNEIKEFNNMNLTWSKYKNKNVLPT